MRYQSIPAAHSANRLIPYYMGAFILLGVFIVVMLRFYPSHTARLGPALAFLDLGYLALAIGALTGAIVAAQNAVPGIAPEELPPPLRSGVLPVVFGLCALIGLLPVAILYIESLHAHITKLQPLIVALMLGYALVALWSRANVFVLRERVAISA
jgi:hypothetical protein